MADNFKSLVVGSVEGTVKDATARQSIETINSALENKADKATTLAGYGITDAMASSDIMVAINETLASKVPNPPEGNGAYMLTVTVNDGVATYSWISYE